MTALVEPPVRDTRVDPSGVLTSRAILIGGLMPSVTDLAAALRALRGLGRTEDVVGFAIPLEGDPSERRVRQPEGPVAKPRFDLMDFLMTAIDPHRRETRFGRWAPGRNAPLAFEVLGDLTRWLVGIYTLQLHDVRGEEDVHALARSNHAAAMHKLTGDTTEGYVGMLATLGVPPLVATEYAARLAGGECILTTCETDDNRAKRDEKIMRKLGARDLFTPVELEVRYGAWTS